MATRELSIALTGELAAQVLDAVKSGEFPTHEAVVEAALQEWKDGKDQHLEYLREAWKQAVASEDDPRPINAIFRDVRQKCGLLDRGAADSR